MRPLLRGLLPLLILALAGCGNGTLGDVWDSFPEEVFNPPDDGGGGGGGGGGATLEEVAEIAGGQGVTGTIKNIALATVAGKTYAFLAAGPDGCHIVDVTEPDLLNASSYVTTIRPLVLATPPAALAGGRVDAVSVVDNAFLICVAVTSAAPNTVTVFNIPLLIAAATSSTADLSGAFIPPTTPGTDAIAVTGDAAGKGGAATGTGVNFWVATGTGGVAAAKVELTPLPSSWTLDTTTTLSLGAPAFTTVTDVAVTSLGGVTTLFASDKRTDGKFAVAMTTPGAPLGFSTVIDSDVQDIIDEFVTTQGNYPLDLAIDTINLYVTGDNEMFVYTVGATGLTLVTTVPNTGLQTIAVSAGSNNFVVGAGDSVRAGTSVLGQARVTGSLSFPNTFTVRGVALRSTTEGLFFLVCAGTGGLRVLTTPSAPGP